MTITESPAAAPARSVSGPASGAATAGLYDVVTTGDHKTLGRLYVGFAGLFFLATAVLGVVNAVEKADTESLDVFGDVTTYFQAFWAYRLGLVFLVVLPLFVGLANAVVPLQVGSPSVTFPRAAAAAFWTWLVGSGMLIASFATDGGLGELADGATRSDSVALTLVALGMVIVALCLAAVCIATTVIAARTTGMTLRRVPLFSWSMLVASFVWLCTLPVLFANLVLAYVDYRHGQLRYGLPAAINLQFQWAFWQPQVYAYAIPVLGIMSEIVPVAARVRQRMHEVLLVGIALFGLLSFGAFAQRFDIQDNFLYPAVGIAVLLPLLVVLGGWGDSLRQGRPGAKGPLGALLLLTVAVLMLFAGAAAGALRVIDPFDLLATSATDGVFNLVLLAAVAGGIGGTVYWSAKLTGRLFPEGIARALTLPLLGGIALAGIPDVISGFLDQPTGLVDGSVKDGVQALNVVSLVGLVLVALAALGFLAGYARLLAGGPRYAPNNPWQGHTLEWATVSPPPVGNFSEPLPVVRSERPLLDPVPEATDTGGVA
jgi:heme/copper-type cytochrome/quinol oxidase subunit 1